MVPPKRMFDAADVAALAVAKVTTPALETENWLAPSFKKLTKSCVPCELMPRNVPAVLSVVDAVAVASLR